MCIELGAYRKDRQTIRWKYMYAACCVVVHRYTYPSGTSITGSNTCLRQPPVCQLQLPTLERDVVALHIRACIEVDCNVLVLC